MIINAAIIITSEYVKRLSEKSTLTVDAET
jgi:hypothetical protein